MLGSNLIKNILSLVVIAVVVFLSYRYVTRPLEAVDATPGIAITTEDSAETESDNLADVFSNLLEKLATVDFQGDNTIFKNPVFQNGLVSFSRELPSIDKARANPFAPVEGNPVLYIHYPSPAPTSLTFATSSNVLPIATTTPKR